MLFISVVCTDSEDEKDEKGSNGRKTLHFHFMTISTRGSPLVVQSKLKDCLKILTISVRVKCINREMEKVMLSDW